MSQSLGRKFFEKRSIERLVWWDEKDFMMDVPFNAQNNHVYGMDKKDKIPGNQVLCDMERFYKTFFFFNENGLKVNAKT